MVRYCLIVVSLLVPALASALTVEGTRYPPTVKVQGRTLRLVGAGVREVTFMNLDVYTMGVYVESRTCDPRRLVHDDEAKMIRMDFVRDVPGDKMMDGLRETFAKRTPRNAPASLRRQIEVFVRLFRHDIPDRTVARIIYIPGKGTTTFMGSKQIGPTLEGHDFQKVLWDIWFNRDTCCPNLIDGLRETCRNRPGKGA